MGVGFWRASRWAPTRSRRLRDESLEDLDDFPAPEVIAPGGSPRRVEDLTAALAGFEAVAAALEAGATKE
jgi:type I restriction enzyme M protein